MKKAIYTILFFASISIYAQNDLNNNGITLGAHIPEQAEGIPSTARRMLLNKLGQIITKNGISDDVNNSRFILVPNITVLSKDVLPTAPIKIALNLEVTLYIGDGVAGNLFSTETLQLKGVGSTEIKAYISAIKRLSAKNPVIQKFIAKGKEKIVSYYNNNCTNIHKKASLLEAQGNSIGALAILTSIPEMSTCYNSKQISKIKSLYKKAIDQDCKEKLNESIGIWAANQDINSANKVGVLLSTIDPNASCFNDVKKLYGKISLRVKDLSDRGWEYQLKELDLEVTTVHAARDVGVAYGNNQPQSTYNTRGWY